MGKSSLKSVTSNGDPGDVLLLDAPAVRTALPAATVLKALEAAYRGLAGAPADAGQSLGFQTTDAKFHVKAGLLPASHRYFAAKINANFPQNARRNGLPTIQGLVLLADGTDGRPLAVLHSGELTARRTAAATALAAFHGARADARRLAVIGCGAQARHQAEALAAVRELAGITACDIDAARAEAFAAWARQALEVPTVVVDGVASALAGADMAVTCTTATRAIIMADMVPPGCFVAAVGADNPDKQEIDPALFAHARVIVDDLAQCAAGGDLAHAIRAGVVAPGTVTATLADLAAGAAPGRLSETEIVLFDSTGTGVQDVAAAAAAYEAARERGLGRPFRFAA